MEVASVAVGGDWVAALRAIEDDAGNGPFVVAEPGDVGRVIEMRAGYLPLIEWERTGWIIGAVPGVEFEVLCAADFATTEATTPRKKRTEFVRRGAV